MGYDKYSKITTNMNYRTIPNSHFWSDLNEIINAFDFNSPNKEYLIIGLKNTIEHGYELKSINNVNANILKTSVFSSIDEIVEYVKSDLYDEKNFYIMLNTTIALGYNLTNGLKMQRRDVYKRIDEERNYQDQRWHGCVPDKEKAIAEWLNYIEYHLEKAKERVYNHSSDEALAELRKIAALAVRAMEIHGCPERIPAKISTSNGGIAIGYSAGMDVSGTNGVFVGRHAGLNGLENPDGCCGIYEDDK